MPYIEPEVVKQVRRIDLLTYLRTREPLELVHLSGNVYTTRTHDSLKISNGKWCWWSRGIGGASALDYLIKVNGYSFYEAVQILMENESIQIESMPQVPVKEQPKRLLLPAANRNVDCVMHYLEKRGIDKGIIVFCLENEILYESRDYHNAVFVGKDKEGEAKYAALRGTGESEFKGEANGSDKYYSFHIEPEGQSKQLDLFESAIDLLSFATLKKLEDKPWRETHLLSLAGIYKPTKSIKERRMPRALEQYLKDHSEITTVVLHLDNDRPGVIAANAIQEIVKTDYICINAPPKNGKDENDNLRIYLKEKNRTCEGRFER